MLDRTRQPATKVLEKIDIQQPERNLMPNGIMLNVLRTGKEEVVRLDLMIRGGRYHQSQPLQSVFTNRMLREGSSRYTSTQIEEKLDYYGAWLELSSGMEYSYVTLYTLNKYYPVLLGLIEDILKEPVFPEKEFATTLDINKQQFLVNSSRGDFISQKYFNLSVFGAGHPGGRTITSDDYDLLKRDSLREFYMRHYHSGNCSIYLSGKISDAIIRDTECVFGKDKWGATDKRTEFPSFHPVSSAEKRIFVERADSMQNSLRMGGIAIPRNHPDYLKMRVLMTLFGGYFGSRLMSNIREDKGYTYGISAGILFYPGTGILMISTEADAEYTENIIKEVYHEMKVLKDELISEKELSIVKNYMLGQMCRTYEGTFSLADAWTFIETNHLDDTYYQRSLDAVREITAAELQELAIKYFNEEELTEVIAGKKMPNKL